MDNDDNQIIDQPAGNGDSTSAGDSKPPVPNQPPVNPGVPLLTEVDAETGYPVARDRHGRAYVVDGQRYYRRMDGAIVDRQTTKVVANPGGGANSLGDPARARQINDNKAHYAALAAAAARNGLARVGKRKSSLDAWSRIVEEQAKLAMKTEKGRDSTIAARFVGHAAGTLPDARTIAPGAAAGGMTIDMSADVAARFIALLAARRGE